MYEFYLRSMKREVLLEKNSKNQIIERPYQIKILFREF